MIKTLKPGHALVSITPMQQNDAMKKIALNEATKRDMEEAKRMDGTHPVESILQVSEEMVTADVLKVKVGDRVIINPHAHVIRIRLANGKVSGMVNFYDILAIVEG
jgi:co-chaperonin GroES (HSP10)